MTTEKTNGQIIAQATLLRAIENLSLATINLAEPGARICMIDEDEDQLGDHWISNIGFDGGSVQVELAVHFQTKTGRNLIASDGGMDSKLLNARTCRDYLNEFGNLVVGRIKSVLSSTMTLKCIDKTFVPHLSPSEDEVIGVTLASKILEERWWKITWATGPLAGDSLLLYTKVNCSESLSDEALKKISREHVAALNHKGEVEFFSV